MQSEIKQWGNSAAVRLSSKLLAEAKMDISSPIRIQVKAGRIIIEAYEKAQPKIKLPFSEASLLEGLSAYGAHADELIPLSDLEAGI